MSCFSLRGKYSLSDNSNGAGIRIFDYVSPDRQRAWKVTRAYFWPVGVREDVAGDPDARYLAQAALMTDFKKGVEWNTICDPSENRSFGFGMWGGYTRENGGSDFIVGDSTQISEFIIDPDTLITKEMWFIMSTTKEGTNNPTREWGYMIELEEVKVTASQSLFQQIKGMGQKIPSEG